MRIAKEMGAVTICITKMNKSPMLKYTDINLFTSISDFNHWKDKGDKEGFRSGNPGCPVPGIYYEKCGQNTSKYLKKVQNAIDCNKM